MNRLLRQLRREAKRNPKKAGILGILALVAVWFWAPLAMDWFRSDGTKAAAASKDDRAGLAASALGGSVPAQDPGQPAEESPPLGWKELVRLQQEDPKSQPGQIPAGGRDPFVTPKSQLFPPLPMLPKEEEQKEPEKKPKAVVADLSPQQLGLALSSTIVGPGGGLATINGKAYRPQGVVVVPHDAQPVEFQLTEIHPRRVVLVRNGKSYSLEIPRPDGAGD